MLLMKRGTTPTKPHASRWHELRLAQRAHDGGCASATSLDNADNTHRRMHIICKQAKANRSRGAPRRAEELQRLADAVKRAREGQSSSSSGSRAYDGSGAYWRPESRNRFQVDRDLLLVEQDARAFVVALGARLAQVQRRHGEKHTTRQQQNNSPTPRKD